MPRKPTIVDLFCGCGGFGLGAELAGFHSLAAVDIDDTLRSAYNYNFPRSQVLKGDISEMETSAWRLILGNQEVDGVIGGPPCQGFSRIGTGDTCDPRRSLLAHFFRTINIIRPKFFVMENVEGLLDDGNIQGLQEAISTVDARYTVLDPVVVDASAYGAPTKRHRVIVVGYDQSRMSAISKNDLEPQTIPLVTVEEAISDIPSPLPMNALKGDLGWKNYKKVKNLSEYAQAMRRLPEKHLGNKEARELLSEGLCSGHFNTIHTDPVKERFECLIPGKTDKISKAKRLEWNGLCPTLRAGTGSDHGSHQAVRPIHPAEPRVITVREAARLQGFPDWFCFHPSKWHSFRMIGNSVSPIVAKSILSTIRLALTETNIGNTA